MLSLIQNSRLQRHFSPVIFVFTALLHAFADPLRTPVLAFLASVVNLGLYFHLIASYSRSRRFFLGCLWYALAFGIPFRWFATTTYHGPFILVAYAIVLILFSFQFGLLSLLVRRSMRLFDVFALCGFWVIMEWMRLFLLSGSVWYPFGLSLSWSIWSSQIAQIGGVYLLTACVMLANLLFFRLLEAKTMIRLCQWLAAGLLPFLIGGLLLGRQTEQGTSLRVAAVQTGLEVDQRGYFHDRPGQFVHPLLQWDQHLLKLGEKVQGPIDLILFPESLSLFTPYAAVYHLEDVEMLFSRHFNRKDIVAAMPALDNRRYIVREEGGTYVTNALIVQTLANLYQASVVIGLDHTEGGSGKAYNAAWHFKPGNAVPKWYGKQVLVPIAEYIPSKWFKKIAARYGIEEFFSSGSGPVIMRGKVAMAPTICYEECYGHLMRSNRNAGAELLLNLSNDGWFPNTDLPHAHFIHSRLRSVEMGLPLVRACHTGYSGCIDSRGRILNLIQEGRDVLVTDLECAPKNTLYVIWGDAPVVALSFLLCVFAYLLGKIGLDKKRISAVNS